MALRHTRRNRLLLYVTILFGLYVGFVSIASRRISSTRPWDEPNEYSPSEVVYEARADNGKHSPDSAMAGRSPGNASTSRSDTFTHGTIAISNSLVNSPGVAQQTERAVAGTSRALATSKEVVGSTRGVLAQSQTSPPSQDATLLETYSVSKLEEYVRNNNEAQTIYNEQRFPISPEDRKAQLVVVIQVHDRYRFLRHTLENLGKARNVESILLVISADYVSSELVSIVQGVLFCQAMLVLSPHTIQLHPSSFPGTDPKDCPARITRDQAVNSGCLNAQHPDMYGHYREAAFSAIKLHWWWKASFVFDKIRALHDHTGWVLMLEEDHLVSPDFVVVIGLLDTLVRKERPYVDVINIGRQKPTGLFPGNGFTEEDWFSVFNNMGFALRKPAWETLRNCSKTFCDYDDYNWDWTFQMTPWLCKQYKWKTLAMVMPRVYHIGTCGIHQKKGQCKPDEESAKVLNIFKTRSTELFPTRLEWSGSTRQRTITPKKPNGGWGDVRDHNLCMSIVS
ncbi:alpha-1,6-mannosyl-glycoprotein 2-beta-N-acetylglucosaminyltransferase-like [Sycon ciliatum]|uniref:alpha-1,6-mannosyl-glycoprotein 2-beta-N-acetylglucosaminyltransferase-like n=1 Tax=Sycon ciliatum TaxID=27933 RepID=UPI0031F6C274